ncbi:hypothetical protein [Candidatus Rhabdochlamydia porcellionis]|uniref:Uncharacterized protein n=1 Tax=Candidatus Rhabdochlamydia porcellionis TaxID=225148 RepID=A0ABX8YZU7_9BACT|nr:hypothetical protein [Candidatus Rhabdochlamydia porcellionis]QZA58929.1 hypothetical protein RHAB15C_0000810 [Candidatus Rhabdochlamydia porcellionis]
MSGIVRVLNRTVSTVSSVVQSGGVLRGQVGFERWYFHYHNKLSPQQMAKDPSIQIFCRLWAISSAIESFIKVIIVGLSALYYVYRENYIEVEKRVDVLYEQDNSLYYSFVATYSPEKAVKDFSLYNEKDPAQSAIRTQWFGYSLGKYSWGTFYTGETTLEMLLNTH